MQRDVYQEYVEEPISNCVNEVPIDDAVIEQNIKAENGEMNVVTYAQHEAARLLAYPLSLGKSMVKQGERLGKKIQVDIQEAKKSRDKHTRYEEIHHPNPNAKPWTWFSGLGCAALLVFSLSFIGVGMNSLKTLLVNNTDFILDPTAAFFFSLIIPAMAISLEFIARKVPSIKYAALTIGILLGLVWVYLVTKSLGTPPITTILEEDSSYLQYTVQILTEIFLSGYMFAELIEIYNAHQPVKPKLIENEQWIKHNEIYQELRALEQAITQKMAEWQAYLTHHEKLLAAIPEKSRSTFLDRRSQRLGGLVVGKSDIEIIHHNNGKNSENKTRQARNHKS